MIASLNLFPHIYYITNGFLLQDFSTKRNPYTKKGHPSVSLRVVPCFLNGIHCRWQCTSLGLCEQAPTALTLVSATQGCPVVVSQSLFPRNCSVVFLDDCHSLVLPVSPTGCGRTRPPRVYATELPLFLRHEKRTPFGVPSCCSLLFIQNAFPAP